MDSKLKCTLILNYYCENMIFVRCIAPPLATEAESLDQATL